MNRLLFLILILLSVSSCLKQNDRITVEKTVDYFDKLTFESYFEVYITQGTENKVRIEGAEKIISKMSIERTSDSTLHFKNKFKGAFLHPKKNDVIIYVTVKNLSLLQADETCTIFSTNTLTGNELGIIFAGKLNEANLDLNYNSVFYWNNFPCGGKLILTGSSNELKIWNYALMTVDASGMTSQNVFIENSSKGDCSVHAIQGIEYSILGEGNILLTGNPFIQEKIVTSSGKLIRL